MRLIEVDASKPRNSSEQTPQKEKSESGKYSGK